jgi:hypothetical protein
LIVGESNAYYRIEVVVNNPLSEDILVSNIDITRDIMILQSCSGRGGAHYTLSDNITIISTDSNSMYFTTVTTPETGGLARFRHTVDGTLIYRCTGSGLVLSMNTSFMLSSNSHTSFYIDVPKRFTVTKAELVDAFGLPIKNDATSIDTYLVPDSSLRREGGIVNISFKMVTTVGVISVTKSLK